MGNRIRPYGRHETGIVKLMLKLRVPPKTFWAKIKELVPQRWNGVL